jgi:hypothetical protein
MSLTSTTELAGRITSCGRPIFASQFGGQEGARPPGIIRDVDELGARILGYGKMVLRLLKPIDQRFEVMEPSPQISCLPGCHALLPPELETERLCVLHFILSIENTCSEMRHETAMDGASTSRRLEIVDYIKTTAVKLAFVATGSVRLTDDMKKRILTTFLTLMNLQESIDRCASRLVRLRPPKSIEGPIAATTAMAS